MSIKIEAEQFDGFDGFDRRDGDDRRYDDDGRYDRDGRNGRDGRDGRDFNGFPPMGQPPRQPFPGGPGQGPSDGMPSGPPPRQIPQRRGQQGQRQGIYAVDPGAIYNCRYRYTYIWLENGRSFWAYLIFVGRRSVAGYRWIGYRWVYFGTDLDNISDFVCY